MLGLLLLMVLYAGRLSSFFRENIGVSLVIKSDATAREIVEFKNKAEDYPFVKSTNYISKEEAAGKLQQELGEDFVGFIGTFFPRKVFGSSNTFLNVVLAQCFIFK